MTKKNTQKQTPTEDKPAEETKLEEKVETSAEQTEQPQEKPQPKTDEPMAQKKAEEEKKKPKIKPGMTVRVHQKIRETNAKGEEKERIQIFEGIVLACKHGQETGATITVRKISHGVGVEKIFPIHSPNVVKIEPIKQAKVSRAKLYFLRNWKKRLKETLIDKK